MTATAINPEPPKASPDQFETLYRAWRYARAQWDLAQNDPLKPEGLSDEEDEAHCDIEHRALLALLLHPVSEARYLARKMQVIRDQHVWGFGEAVDIFDGICGDARRVAFHWER